MAKKYIDAEKLERHFERCIDEVINTNGVTEDFEIALKATKNQPAEDVQEVRRARWKRVASEYYCSNCTYSMNYITMFCPHCGARMEGENNDP